jgi:hypothetical protein
VIDLKGFERAQNAGFTPAFLFGVGLAASAD